MDKRTTPMLDAAKKFTYELFKSDIFDAFIRAFQEQFQCHVSELDKRVKYEVSCLYHLVETYMITTNSYTDNPVKFDDIVEKCCLILLLDNHPMIDRIPTDRVNSVVVGLVAELVDTIGSEVEIRPENLDIHPYEYIKIHRNKYTLLVECVGDYRILKYHGVIDDAGNLKIQ